MNNNKLINSGVATALSEMRGLKDINLASFNQLHEGCNSPLRDAWVERADNVRPLHYL